MSKLRAAMERAQSERVPPIYYKPEVPPWEGCSTSVASLWSNYIRSLAERLGHPGTTMLAQDELMRLVTDLARERDRAKQDLLRIEAELASTNFKISRKKRIIGHYAAIVAESAQDH